MTLEGAMRNAVLVLLLAVRLGALPAGADGMLDPSFGNGGLVITGFPPPPPPNPFSANELVASLVVLPDGRAVAAGRASTEPTTPGMGVARYLPSGALDTTFSGDGLVSIGCQSFGAGNGGVAVLLQPDGRLIVFGTCPPSLFTVARLNVDGSLDASFGTGGMVFTSFPFFSFAVTGLLQPDGRIVAVGYGSSAAGNPLAPMAARYNADGSLDSSFGTGGQLTLPLAQEFLVRGAALQPDGKLVIAGRYGPPGSLDFGLVRLLPNGAADPSFDGDGLATANFPGTEDGYSVVLLPDGRHVVAGSHDGDFALVRFLPDGSLDTAFGTGGLATASFGAPVTPDEAVRLPNGKLMLAGSTNDTGPAQDFLLARFHADGPLDPSFGNAGFLRTDVNASSNGCQAVAIAGPDLVLAAGGSCQSVNCDFALARYIATTPVELLAFEVE
jgi:uncharacterized delta-60 repeat protein